MAFLSQSNKGATVANITVILTEMCQEILSTSVFVYGAEYTHADQMGPPMKCVTLGR